MFAEVSKRRFVKRLAIGKRERDEEAALLPTPQRPDHNRNFVASLQAVGVPTLSRQIVGTIALNAPFVDTAIVLRDVHLDPAMRIGPLEVFNHSHEGHLLVPIEHRERVMRGRGAGAQHEKRTQERDQSPLHRSPRISAALLDQLCDPLPQPA